MLAIPATIHSRDRVVYFACLLTLPLFGCSDLGNNAEGGAGQGGDACHNAGDCTSIEPCTDVACVDGRCVSSAATDGTPCGDGTCEAGTCLSGTVTITLTNFDFNPGGPRPPVEGIVFCQLGTDNCATSNKDGRTALVVPRMQEVTIVASKDGYGSWAFAGVSDDLALAEGVSSTFTDEQFSEIAADLGIAYPWKAGTGTVSLGTFPAIPGGVTFAHLGPGNPIPFYFDSATQRYSTEIDATTDQFGVIDFPLSEGGFAELPTGEHQFEAGGVAMNCTKGPTALPGDEPHRIRVPVVEGHFTFASIRCEGP